MRTNAVLDVLLSIISWITVPIQFVTTFVLGILVTVTFGLLLWPCILMWMVVFLYPLLGLSWLWQRLPFLRFPLALVGIPLALAGDIYASWLPSMGEMESRYAKMLITVSWPYSVFVWRAIRGEVDALEAIPFELIYRIQKREPALGEYFKTVTSM